MASATKQTTRQRARKESKMGRRRKNVESRKSTKGWDELFGAADAKPTRS